MVARVLRKRGQAPGSAPEPSPVKSQENASGSTEEPTSTLTSTEDLSQQIVTGVEVPVSSPQKRRQRIRQPTAGKAGSAYLKSSSTLQVQNCCAPDPCVKRSIHYFGEIHCDCQNSHIDITIQISAPKLQSVQKATHGCINI